jgi:N-acetyl-anhydromuramyl-L-alanine amidase AmpD
MVNFNEDYWQEVITRPDWYMEFVPYANEVHDELAEGSEELKEFNKTVRHFFEKALQENRVVLAKEGPSLDEQRQAIDTIVIHHTSTKPGYRLSYMNATQLLNVYAPYFTHPTDDRERSLKGQPIWSNHVQNGKQVFYVYHWLMRMDGRFERLLDDSQIGWHAGNWEVNKRSIAICLDNDYEKQDPIDEILKKLASFIQENYSNIRLENIIGHCEANPKTICPGTNFKSVWKAKLLNYLQ